MTAIKTITPFLLLFLFFTTPSFGLDVLPEEVTKRSSTHHINSQYLGEERTIYVRLPLRFDPSKEYPVIYVTDGEYNFEFVAAYIDYLTNLYSIPEMIVTGAKNVNRNRDFVPREDSRFPYTGEADIFYEFVTKEWTGFIEDNFNTNGDNILAGHSFGGVFAFYSLFKNPGQFSAYIALGSSTWVSNRVLFEEAEEFFKNHPTPKAFVYASVGENDGGATVPDGNLFAQLFEEKAPETLEWYYEVTPKTDHFTNFTLGFHNAIQYLFPNWGFDKELDQIARKKGVQGVNDWFEDKKESLGFRFQPLNFDLGVVALRLAQSELYSEANIIMDHLKTYIPEHPRVYVFSAMINEWGNKPGKALTEYKKGLELTIKYGFHPNIIQLPTLEAGIERAKKALANTTP